MAVLHFPLSSNVLIGGLIFIIFTAFIILSDNFLTDLRAMTASSPIKSCDCVIFRFDDVRNGYFEGIQNALLNFFISKNQSLVLGVVMNQIHNDTALFQKINEGYKKGLFEIGVHGWDHVDYSTLTKNEQEATLQKAAQKSIQLFGNHPKLFIPPFNLFNNSTLSAMEELNFGILSSAIYYDEPDVEDSFRYDEQSLNTTIIHLPEMTDFSIYYNDSWVKVPIKIILADMDYDVKTYGYSVVMVHPDNFAKQVNGSLIDVVDTKQIRSLDSIINAIKHKNLRTMTISKAASLK